jgi:hypothetical protein
MASLIVRRIVATDDAKEVTTTAPYNTYRLEVRNNGTVHVVVWKDAYKPNTEQANQSRALLSMIFGFIHDHPDFKRLPSVILGCE